MFRNFGVGSDGEFVSYSCIYFSSFDCGVKLVFSCNKSVFKLVNKAFWFAIAFLQDRELSIELNLSVINFLLADDFN